MIPDDVPALEAAVVDHGATLVVVDVFTAYLSGGHDSYKDADVRRALAPLAAMAEATGSAVVLIRHPASLAAPPSSQEVDPSRSAARRGPGSPSATTRTTTPGPHES
ncbi:MAG: AAA family ATPase [Acidimicrobiales bacterium]